MVSTLDILYIVLAFCSVMLTVILVVLGIEVIGVVRDVRRISNNIEHIAGMVDRVAMVVFPGIERMAKGAESIEKTVGSFLKKKADMISKR
ncbi:MAG TPA: hypothetical protein VLA04_06370 [Verrucomicrobiae bacterium]|nr:hypothetical protein [Verrucomicrobiae bacterium]